MLLMVLRGSVKMSIAKRSGLLIQPVVCVRSVLLSVVSGRVENIT